MNNIQTNYQALVTEENEVPHESVIFHVASEGGKSHWNHVGDLDTFFKRCYIYQQECGLNCILVKELLYLFYFALIFYGGFYSFHCVWFNFDVPPYPYYNKTDIYLSDLFMDVPTCAAGLSVNWWIVLAVGILVTLYQCYMKYHIFCCFHDIKKFYNSALNIDDANLAYVTWHEVQKRIQEVQHEQQMCVHKSDLTELDIYHRILRHENYLVAMVNKNILPLKHNIKVFGEWTYLTTSLLYNIEYLLFKSYASPFKETGTLREDYKKYSKRKELAAELSTCISILAFVNFILIPVIFFYQLLYSFLTYSGTVKHSPNLLSTRVWSLYSRFYLRHFNELDHELHARLRRAYKPSLKYMKAFSSPILVLLSKFFAQVIGCITVYFFVWSLFKEKLLLIDNVLLIGTIGALAFVIFNAMVPDENEIYYPGHLMKQIVSEVHYIPDHFKENPQTLAVRDEFSQLFQYKFVGILEDVMGPVVTPFVLYFSLRPRALDIVDFFRSFTVDVAGVGDVCSFALMDVSRHGNQHWLSENAKADQHQQAEDGKTELSLIHFTLMNPYWQPPPSSHMFINSFREKVHIAKESEFTPENPYYASLNSLSTMGSRYASLVNSIHHSHQQPSAFFTGPHGGSEKIGGYRAVSRMEGPPYIVQGGPFSSLHIDTEGPQSLQSELPINPVELRTADMSFSALYLHEAHQKLMESSKSQSDRHHQPQPETDNNDEASPLLEVRTQPGASYIP